MANKELAKRQRMMYRVEPSQKALKPRNPFVVAAKQRSAGPHEKTASAQRQAHKRQMKKLLDDPGSKS